MGNRDQGRANAKQSAARVKSAFEVRKMASSGILEVRFASIYPTPPSSRFTIPYSLPFPALP